MCISLLLYYVSRNLYNRVLEEEIAGAIKM